MISPSQVMLGIVSKGPMGKLLDSSFQNRNSTDYVLELGAAVGRQIIGNYLLAVIYLF